VSELEREVKRRNALFAAWAACGLPLAGGWRAYYRSSGTPPHWRADLDVRCTICPDASHTSSSGEAYLRNSGGLEEVEKDAWWDLTKEQRGSCTHLLPLRLPPPPEVLALAEMMPLIEPS
jgi:hypothetical protein